MSTTINVKRNEGGVINTGNNSENCVINTKREYQKADDIDWETLNKEVDVLKSNPDSSIKKFANEVGEASKKEDKQGIYNTLSKWIPCIADFISSSFYILEIANKLGIE